MADLIRKSKENRKIQDFFQAIKFEHLDIGTNLHEDNSKDLTKVGNIQHLDIVDEWSVDI